MSITQLATTDELVKKQDTVPQTLNVVTFKTAAGVAQVVAYYNTASPAELVYCAVPEGITVNGKTYTELPKKVFDKIATVSGTQHILNHSAGGRIFYDSNPPSTGSAMFRVENFRDVRGGITSNWNKSEEIGTITIERNKATMPVAINMGDVVTLKGITETGDTYFTADNLVGGENTTIVKDGDVYKINSGGSTPTYPHISDTNNVVISVNGSSDTFAFTADKISSLNTLVENRESYLTQNVADGRYANKAELNYKQDQLTSDNAGDNITITGSGSTLKINATGGAGEKGDPGDSAYEIAVKHGYTGTEDEWLASLKGDTGEKGDPGEKGDKGEPGSYEHITDNTNVVISNSSTADTFEFTADTISTLNEIVTTGEILTPGDGISITDKVVSIKSGGVTAAMLAPNAITSDTIPAGAITNDKIANNSITVDKLSVPSIVTEETNSSITDSTSRPVKLICQKYNNIVEENGVVYNKYIFKRICRCFDNSYINSRFTRVYVYFCSFHYC